MTTSEQIRVLCVRSGVSLSELARRINQTPQNFSVKLKRNTVTQDELSRLLPILEKYGFELRQQIVLNKGMQAVSGRATKNYRMFPNVTESILFLCKDPKPFAKSFLKQRQKELGYSAKQIIAIAFLYLIH